MINFFYEYLMIKKTGLRYAGIEFDDVVNGEGLGAVFFTQYCPHKCKGCQNPTTWSRNGGMPLTKDVIDKLFQYYIDTPFATRLTLSGGDPIANFFVSYFLATEFKKKFPDKKIWLYTGYKFEKFGNKFRYKLLTKLCDVIVDGEYVDSLRDITLPFRGSSNQRLIDVKKTCESGEIVLYELSR